MLKSLKLSAGASALMLLTVIVLAGCGGGGTSGGSGGSGSEEESAANIKPGGTLTVALGEEVNTLDESESIAISDINVTSQINETLFKEAPTGEVGKVVPWLVSKATHTPDYKTWTFTVRPGVKFSTGEPLTSADVAFSLETGKEGELFGAELGPMETVKTPNKSTVVVNFSQSFPELPLVLAQWSFGVVPANYGGVSKKEFVEHPIGTGPFAFSSWKRGTALTLVKNRYYWVKGEPHFEKVVYSPGEDAGSRVSQVRDGTLNIAFSPAFNEIAGLESNPATQIVETPLNVQGWYAFLNTAKAPFDNKKMREAVWYAMDREAVQKAAGSGIGEPMNSVITPNAYGYDQHLKNPEFNIEKAKELVAEAEKEGASTSLEMLAPSENPYILTAVQILQQNLENAGMNPTIRKIATGQGYAEAGEGNYQLFASPDGVPAGVASEWMTWYNAEHGGWTNSPTDETSKLLPEAQQEVNSAKREQMYREYQEIVANERAIVTGNYFPLVAVHTSNLSGVRFGNSGVIWVAEAGFTE